jgi:hypothetical protein
MNYHSMNHHQTKTGHSLKNPGNASGKFPAVAIRFMAREWPRVRSRLSNLLMLPLLLMLLSGGVNFYLHSKYEALIPVDKARYTQLQESLQSAKLDPASRKTVIAIAREAIDDDERTSRILFHVGFIFIYIGIVYLIVVWKHLKPVKNPGIA